MKGLLKKFQVLNYRGFSKVLEWDLERPGNYQFNSDAIKDGVVRNGIVYGPNGSGKSSLSLAVFDITNHLSQKRRKPDYYDNFVNLAAPDKTVDFQYQFVFDDKELLYNYSKDAQGNIVAECLEVNGKLIFNHQGQNLEISKKFGIPDSVVRKIASSANSISLVNYLLSSVPLTDDHYLMKLQSFVNSMLWFHGREIREFIGIDAQPTLIEEYFIKNKMLSDFEFFLKSESGQSFHLTTLDGDDKQVYVEMNGHKARFNSIASTGTQELELLYFWYRRMSEASFVFIDEFDAYYHYELSYNICRKLFMMDCQIFLSTHNTSLLTNDLLRPDCYFIVNENQINSLNELTDKELRFGHNIEKLYRGKAFGV